MKNKEKYDLSKLDIEVNRRVNGCGRAISTPIYLSAKYKGDYVFKDACTNKTAFKFIMEWLEDEIPSN